MKKFSAFLIFALCGVASFAGQAFVVVFDGKKYVEFFDEPVAGEYLLAADSDGRVRWQTLSPYESLTLFDGKNAAAFERENGVWKRVNAPSGILADIMAALRGVVAGGEISGGVFDSSKQADGSVVLVPRDAALRKFIEKIVVELKDGTREPRKVVIFDTGGDRTELAVRKYISGGIDLSGFFDLSAPQSAKIGRFLGK